jgi:hypothetical protein
MKTRFFYLIVFTLFFAVIIGFIPGCDLLSSELTPPDSQYPADIIGKVIKTDFIKHWIEEESSTLKPKDGNVFWVIEISVKNKTYPQPAIKTISGHEQVEKVTWGYWHWAIEVDDKIFNPPEAFKILTTPILTIPEGQTAKLVNCFEVPKNISIDKAKLVYIGQQPYSYGELSGGDTEFGYDFLANKVITQSEIEIIATVKRIWVSAIWVGGGSLFVELEPTSHAIAHKVYAVELYEKGVLRATAKVSWNQPEINVSSMKPVEFSATREESEAYSMESDLSNIFSVQVHE